MKNTLTRVIATTQPVLAKLTVKLAAHRRTIKQRLTVAILASEQGLNKLADRLNGNAARRQLIKQRLTVAMLAAEDHRIVAARAAKLHDATIQPRRTAIHWRAAFHRHAI
ncbi:MAG: hypothetical protein ACRDBT_05760 [Aeromonas sp.]